MCVGVLPACMHVYMYVCMCTICRRGYHGGLKRVSSPLELELAMIVSHHEGVGNQTWILEEEPVLLTTEQSL